MIHTIQLLTTISEDKIVELAGNPMHIKKRTFDDTDLGIYADGFTVEFKRKPYSHEYYMYSIVDLTQITGKIEVVESDIELIENKIHNYLMENYEIEYASTILNRIDYKIDVIVPQIERYMLMYLFRKRGLKKLQHLKKYSKYETSLYLNSGSRGALIYDRAAKARNKGKEVDKFHKDILRIEVSLNPKHLYYRKKKFIEERTLSNYFREDRMEENLKRILNKFIHPGDFYNINLATDIINESEIKDRDKKMLREFLIKISCSSLSTVKKESKSRFKRLIKLLEELNINPILIPKNKNPDMIKNPFDKFFSEWTDIKKQ